MQIEIARGIEALLRSAPNLRHDRNHRHANASWERGRPARRCADPCQLPAGETPALPGPRPQRILPRHMGRIHLGTIFGTSITLDFSFLILILFFVMTDVQ